MIRPRPLPLRLSAAAACCLLGAAALAQTPAPKPPDAISVFHPTGPLPSYEVATIKPADPTQRFAGTTLRNYIARAYGVPTPWGMPGAEFEGSQVIGGPGWIDTDKYEIKGKASDEAREAMQSMPSDQRLAEDEKMEQALLADRFHLKVHFETREMRVFALVPAKGGLKITPVDPAPTGPIKPPKPGDPVPPGMMRLSVSSTGVSVLDAPSTTIERLSLALRGQSPEIAGRPILNKTGFTGNFDLKDFRFAGVAPPQHGAASGDPDAPSLPTALEDKLGIKLVPERDPVEVVVIDSIDRPSEN